MNTNSNPPPPPSNRQILDEASAWFVEFRVGDSDLNSRAEFDRWLRQSPEHVRAYMEIARTYHELGALDSERVARLGELISAAAQRDPVVRLEPNPPQETAKGTPRSTRPKLGRWIPASFAAAIAAGLVVWLALPKHTTYSTGVGETRTVRMPDGSMITLNAITEIKVGYTKTARVIDLVSGQAFFQVIANRDRPFFVRSGFAVVKDVGTQFDVDRRPGSTTVTVVEGRIALYPASEAPSSFMRGSAIDPGSSSGAASPAAQASATGLRRGGADSDPQLDSGTAQAAILAAGEQAIVSAHEVSTRAHANIGAATSWLDHRFIFDDSPLSEVVAQFNRYNPRQIIIQNAALDSLRISGVYSSTDSDSFLRFLRAQPGIEVTQVHGAISIDRK